MKLLLFSNARGPARAHAREVQPRATRRRSEAHLYARGHATHTRAGNLLSERRPAPGSQVKRALKQRPRGASYPGFTTKIAATTVAMTPATPSPASQVCHFSVQV